MNGTIPVINCKKIKVDQCMKGKLRVKILKQLKALDDKKKSVIEKKLSDRLFQQAFWQHANVIGVTYSTLIEWDTEQIIQQAWKEEKIVVIPKSNQTTKTMDFYQINAWSDLERGYANILEPKETVSKEKMNDCIDLLIVPGLMFDEHGYRLGFGGGFYDRYLADPTHHCTLVSLASQFQIVDKLPIDNYDIPVDYIITEEKCLHIKDKKDRV